MTRSTMLAFALLLGCTADGGDLPTPPAESLCNADETSFFSCVVPKTGESFSLCGHIEEKMRPDHMWLQFRKSTNGRHRHHYPTEKKNSLQHFTAINAAHAAMNEDWVIFSDGKTQYSLVNYMGMDGKVDSRVMSESQHGDYKMHFCKSPPPAQRERFKLLGEGFLEYQSSH